MDSPYSSHPFKLRDVTRPLGEHPQHKYESAQLSRPWSNREMRGYPSNATQTNWEAIVSSHGPSCSSHRNEQKSQQVYAQSQPDFGFFAYDSPANISSQNQRDIDIYTNSPLPGYTIETGCPNPYHMSSGPSSTIAPSQSLPYHNHPPSDVPTQTRHHSSWLSTENWPHSTYGSSSSSYSSNTTTQAQTYGSNLDHASYPNALILMPNDNAAYASGPASMGGTPFSTMSASLSPSNAIGHAEVPYQNLLTPSPLLGFHNMPNFIGSSASLLSFPIVTSPENIPSGINFNDFHAGNSSFP